jgi:hypothetical protein
MNNFKSSMDFKRKNCSQFHEHARIGGGSVMMLVGAINFHVLYFIWMQPPFFKAQTQIHAMGVPRFSCFAGTMQLLFLRFNLRGVLICATAKILLV